ncbi:MAG: hypothetical protein H6518_02475 [Microthrixaceae bacterium]|nr:hypothetical protein [Microthrixaceae bacterium]
MSYVRGSRCHRGRAPRHPGARLRARPRRRPPRRRRLRARWQAEATPPTPTTPWRPDRAPASGQAGAFGEDADEWWLQPVAGRLEELRLLALGERAEALIDGGHHQDAVVDLSALVADQPLREQFVALLMRALYLGGRQAEALRAFQAFTRSLADETGLEPSEARSSSWTSASPGAIRHWRLGSAMAVPGYMSSPRSSGGGAFGSVYARGPAQRGSRGGGQGGAAGAGRRSPLRGPLRGRGAARGPHRASPTSCRCTTSGGGPAGRSWCSALLRVGSLSDREAGGPLGLDEATRLVDEVGARWRRRCALGVVHRDVKLANILPDEAGNSYLADFGIAQLDAEREGDADLRSAGSPLLRRPEQLRDAQPPPPRPTSTPWPSWSGRRSRARPRSQVDRHRGRARQARRRRPAPRRRARRRPCPRCSARPGHRAPPDDRYPTIAEFVAAWHAPPGEGGDLIRTTGRPGVWSRAGAVARTRGEHGPDRGQPTGGSGPSRRPTPPSSAAATTSWPASSTRRGRAGFVTVVGPSGSGKSSLVHAGSSLPCAAAALVVSMVPGPDPMLELRSALRQVATAADEATLDARLRDAGGPRRGGPRDTGPGRGGARPGGRPVRGALDAGHRSRRPRPRGGAARAAADAGAPSASWPPCGPTSYDLPLQHPALGPVVARRRSR